MDENEITPTTTPGAKLPEKYIRTFAGDIETVKKGGAPDLVPLNPAVEKPIPTPIPVPTLIPPPIAPPLPIPAPEIPKVNHPETYSGDFSDRMKEMHASTATVLAAEQDRAERAPRTALQEPSRISLPYIIVGAVLLIASIVGGYVAYTHYVAVSSPVAPAPSVPAPIFVDEREEISGTGPVLLQAIEKSVSRPLAAGTVRLLYVASTTATINVFSLLPVSSMPDVLIRNMNAVGSMAGVVNVGGDQSPFFILSLSSYSNVFSGMLQWEPLMPGDLADLFPAYPTMTTGTVATSTATTTQKTATKTATTTAVVPAPSVTFLDATIDSHDVRVYRDAAGRDVLVYGFWNQATLVIARDAAAFTEIVQRLATARAQ